MKAKTFLLFLFYFVITAARAQTPQWDSTYRPGLYEFEAQAGIAGH